MEVTARIQYLTYLLIGIIFLITGFALSELEILQVNTDNFDTWIEFLAPWIGDEEGGLPRPW